MILFDLELFRSGGKIMWVLFVMAGIFVVVTIERLIYLHRRQIRATAFVAGIKNILAKRRIVEALTVCEETPGPVAAVVKAALLHADAGAEALRFHVQEAAIVELPALERRLGALAAIARVTPLVGLLGTVLAMSDAFSGFMNNYTTPAHLSVGFRQALLCTAASLALAVPVHLAHHLLAGRVRALVRDIEWSGNEIMRYLLGEYRGGAEKSEP